MCQNCDNCPFTETPNGKEIVYEIHVTVKHRDTFIEDCYEIGVKPIIIDMGEGIPTHSMTSSTVKGSDESVLSTAHHFASIFEHKGYEVERVKIETVPWHPKANDPEPGQYFEAHFPILIEGDGYLVDEVLKSAPWLHRSRNLLKKSDKKIQMATFRRHDMTSTQFVAMVGEMTEIMRDVGLKIDKVITEFALYDTNESMDDLWLKTKAPTK